MAKQRTIRKMTLLGIVIWLIMNILRQLILFFFALGTLIPFLNIYVIQYMNPDFYKDLVEENLWDSFKDDFKIVEETKITKLERVR